VGEGRCEAHEFRLYPFSEAIYNGQYYNVSFCTCKQERVGRRPSKAHRQAKNLTFPRFNRDNNFSTPAFILNSERVRKLKDRTTTSPRAIRCGSSMNARWRTIPRRSLRL
jgi:hypothetical protein